MKITAKLKALQKDKAFTPYNCYFLFDPNDFYSTIGFTTDFYTAMESTLPRKTVMSVDYYKEKGLKKHPKKYIVYDEFKNGTKAMRFEVEFINFNDYVASPENFELEKMFGLPTPKQSPDKPVPFVGTFSFWFIVAGTIITTIYMFISRKKTAQSKDNPIPINHHG